MTKKEALDILGLENDAGIDEIKNAYSEKSKSCHPEEDPEGFNRLHSAFSFLHRLYRKDARSRTAARSNDFTQDPEVVFKIEEELKKPQEPQELKEPQEPQQPKIEEFLSNDTKPEGISDEPQDDIETLIKEQFDTKLDLSGDKTKYEEQYIDENKLAVINTAIEDARSMYNKALKNPFYSSRHCMKDLFSKYSTETYKSKRYMNALAEILDDDRIDNSVFESIVKYYGFLEDGKYKSAVDSEYLNLFNLAKKRWSPLNHVNRFGLILGLGVLLIFFFAGLEYVAEIHVSSKASGSIIFAILALSYIYNEGIRRFKKDLVWSLVYFLSAVLFFLVHAMGDLDQFGMPEHFQNIMVILVCGGFILVALLYLIKYQIAMNKCK